MKRFLTRALYHLLGKRLMFCLRPYDYIQLLVERELNHFLNCSPRQIGMIVIVGGYQGHEIPRLMRTYPNAHFHVFEPSKRYFSSLRKRFAGSDRVTCVEMAVSDTCENCQFHETNLRGSGSLLKVGTGSRRDYGMKEAESFAVTTTTLDAYLAELGLADQPIDLLWCDVQGAELKVLQGAAKALKGCSSLFLEVAALEPTYEGGALMTDLNALLQPAGFEPFGLGLDPMNGTGNAFYMNSKKRCRP